MMNHPSLSSMPPSGDFDEERYQKISQQDRPSGFGRRIWRGWLWLTSPRPGHFGTDLVGPELLRRSRGLSVLCLVGMAALALVIPRAVIQPRSWVTVLVIAGFCLVATALNRAGKIPLAG